MLTAWQSLRVRGSAGDPIPEVFKALSDKGATFRRGELVLISSGPGTGKSALTLTLAMKSSVPTAYFSADSNAFNQMSRMVAISNGCTMEEASRAVRTEDMKAIGDSLSNGLIRFDYRATPSTASIERSLKAYEEAHGDPPFLAIVDNVTNVRSGVEDDDDPFSGLESLMDYLHDLARQTGACVVGLHHVTGGYNDAERPIPLSGVKGQITRVPELVLTLHKKSGEGYAPDTLCVSVVKNRNGRANPSGYDFAELKFDGERMQITDY